MAGTVGARVCGIRGADAAVHRREFLRPGDRDLTLRLQDARHGNAQVVVLREGRADQRLEVRIRKDAPPLEIAERLRGRDRRPGIGAAIDQRNRKLGTLVVGTDHAAGDQASDRAEQLTIARSKEFPTVDGAANAPYLGYRGSDRPATYLDNSFLPQGGFDVAWELDFWGKLRRGTGAAQADLLATDDARYVVMATLVTQVADAYLTLRAWTSRWKSPGKP